MKSTIQLSFSFVLIWLSTQIQAMKILINDSEPRCIILEPDIVNAWIVPNSLIEIRYEVLGEDKDNMIFTVSQNYLDLRDLKHL